MLTTVEGHRLRRHGFSNVQAVKAQFKKAGHFPQPFPMKTETAEGIRYEWSCSCGAKLRAIRPKKGKIFRDLRISVPPRKFVRIGGN